MHTAILDVLPNFDQENVDLIFRPSKDPREKGQAKPLDAKAQVFILPRT